MKLEKGKKTDIDELSKLYDDLIDYLECHVNYPGWRKGAYPTWETAAEGIEAENLYVVRRDGRIAGTIILNHNPETGYEKAKWQNDIEYKDIFVIHTFALHPLFLKQGMGKEMMELAMDYCRAKGAKAIRLDTYEKNTPAIHLYEKCGFQHMDIVDLGYGEFGLDYFKLFQKLL